MFNLFKKKKKDTKPKLDIRDSIKKIGNNINKFNLEDGRFKNKNLTINFFSDGEVSSLNYFKKRKDSTFPDFVSVGLSKDEKKFLSEKLKKKIEIYKKNKIQEVNEFLDSIIFKK